MEGDSIWFSVNLQQLVSMAVECHLLWNGFSEQMLWVPCKWQICPEAGSAMLPMASVEWVSGKIAQFSSRTLRVFLRLMLTLSPYDDVVPVCCLAPSCTVVWLSSPHLRS